MLRLVEEGYIDILPSKGFRLHQMTMKDFIETLQVRLALEAYCATIITKHYQTSWAQELIEVLHDKTAHMYAIYRSDRNVDEYLRYDCEFHRVIIQKLGNTQFNALFDQFMNRMLKFSYMNFDNPERMLQAYEEHIVILEAMESGDVDHIYSLVLHHMAIPQALRNIEENGEDDLDFLY